MMHAVAVEAPHAVAQTDPTRSPQTETMRSPGTDPTQSPGMVPTRSPEADPMRLLQTSVCTRAPRLPPVELGAEGQALRKRLRAFRTQAVRKNYKVSTRPPATFPL